MAIVEEEDEFNRIGDGTSIVGQWLQQDDDFDCSETLILNADGTFSLDEVCQNPDDNEQLSGTYTNNTESITITFIDEELTEANLTFFYKLLDSKLLLADDNYLFSKD